MLKALASFALLQTVLRPSVRAQEPDAGAIVSASAFGVKGDGVSNDRIRLQAAIDASIGKTLSISGRCRIDDKGLDLRNGSRVRFETGASIKLLPHDTPGYQVIRIWDVSNVVLDGATLDGSKELNSAQSLTHEEGWGMGISIAGSSNVTVTSATTLGCWGDGIYIANSYKQDTVVSQNIHISDHHAVACRRQGMSIISGRNVLVERSLWERIGGTAPSAGLDIEPNSNRDVLERIRIVNPVSKQCKIGILVYLAELPGPVPKYVRIEITGQRDEGSSDNAFSVSGLDLKGWTVKGRITNNSATWVDARLTSVENVDYDARGPSIVMSGLRLIR